MIYRLCLYNHDIKCISVLVFYGVGNKNTSFTSVDLFRPRHLKAEDVATSQQCYSHSVHDKGGNTSNLLSHLKTHY